MINCKAINNKNYSQEEREQLFASLNFDAQIPHILLQTCNRIEIYWGNGDIPDSITRHLYRVASGLESNLIGERAIQSQLKQAYQDACDKYKLSHEMHKLFQTAMHTGKKVRTKTHISEGATSHSQAAVCLLKHEMQDLTAKNICIVGINKLNEDIIKFLQSAGCKSIKIINRSVEKAIAIASIYDCEWSHISKMKEAFEDADVIISATSSPQSIIHIEDMPNKQPMLVLDLAFPRDVDANVEQLTNVKLYPLEKIEQDVRNNIQVREGEVIKAEQIIEDEMRKFYEWKSFSDKIVKQAVI